MLRTLRLRDIVLVEVAEIEFGPGFNVLSGETGAGKSILLDALGLALGHRADAKLVREGCARADVVAEFASHEGLDAWLAEREIAGDPGTVLLRRVLESDGRSRAFVNGQPVPATLLRETGEQLLDIHGQHAHQRLLTGSAQRALLDAFAGIEPDVLRLQNGWDTWQDAESVLANAREAGDQIQQDRERLNWQIDELAALKLAPDEWQELETEQKRLANAAALIEGARGAAEALQEDDSAINRQLSRLVARLRPLALIDPTLTPPLELLEGAAIQAAEAAGAMSHYADRIDLDPERLAEVDRRLGAIHTAARKYRLSPEDLTVELHRLQERLIELDRSVDLKGLQEAADRARQQYDQLALNIGVARREAGGRLAAAVSSGIAGLGMASSRFEVAIDSVDPGPAGTERVEFQIAGHSASAPRPLAKVGSGGELSRVGLAITVAAATTQPVGTLVFDEADSGVGGAVAELIGRLMRRLGEVRQVLCVT
ncbi:MAG: DNA repair protein RecN, partial [Betaproteobacteria bacterium]|nr:DNA repair protein RecN [Betaproteobacteria bacterium]